MVATQSGRPAADVRETCRLHTRTHRLLTIGASRDHLLICIDTHGVRHGKACYAMRSSPLPPCVSPSKASGGAVRPPQGFPQM